MVWFKRFAIKTIIVTSQFYSVISDKTLPYNLLRFTSAYTSYPMKPVNDKNPLIHFVLKSHTNIKLNYIF